MMMDLARALLELSLLKHQIAYSVEHVLIIVLHVLELLNIAHLVFQDFL